MLVLETSVSESIDSISTACAGEAIKKPHSNDVTLEEANRDLEHMFKNRRSKPTIFENQVGYVCKKEYTKERGVHFHALFIFDGQKVHKDAYKAEQIGEYWKRLTGYRGSYHNCNRNKYDEQATGIIDYYDEQKLNLLKEHVVSYLCKIEQDIAPIKQNMRSRAFTRGVPPKISSRVGRPRTKSIAA